MVCDVSGFVSFTPQSDDSHLTSGQITSIPFTSTTDDRLSGSGNRSASGNVTRTSPTSREMTSVARLDLSVLVVDDDRSLREGCVTYFQVEGYNVTSVGSGHEAIEIISRRKFDLVMLD